MIKPEKPYTLIGQSGNAFNLIGYTSMALKETGFEDLCSYMFNKAIKNKSYEGLLAFLCGYIDVVNRSLGFSKKDWGMFWDGSDKEKYVDEYGNEYDLDFGDNIDLSDDNYDDYDDDENEIDLSDDED